MKPKFRAWDKHVKKIRKVTEIHFDDSLIYLKANNGKGYYCSFSDIELMQSTGLRDKNGVEIFEGDIIKTGETVDWLNEDMGVIRFLDGAFVIDYHNLDTEFDYICNVSLPVEIIGNIYENPNLLEEVK
ncbi:hypothetical protein IGK74_002431 [Enterococcus sp. AZ150]|uniref:YopX family protein n=1 Tax=Enterococcus sp. AZ150 TaxID=2774866 RepID=UPI003F21A05D